jgi:hypothetical protein
VTEDRDVITVENWAEIRRLHRAEQMPIKAIARVMRVSKNTVRRALRAGEPPKYERPGSVVDAAEPRIRELLKAYPQMPATVIAERIGWRYSITVLRDRVRELRPAYLSADPASRTSYEPGELAQCDLWFPPADIPLGFGHAGSPPVLVMVSGYSRWLAGRMIPSREAADLILGQWEVICQLGAVPRRWCGITRARSAPGGAAGPCWRTSSRRSAAFWASGSSSCGPGTRNRKAWSREPTATWKLPSFLPGRSFASPADFNDQLAGWLTTVNTRFRRHLECAPADRIAADRAAMLELPPIDADQLGWHKQVRLPRDYYVRVDANDYSVHPSVIGRKVSIRADLDRVTASCEGRLAASHQRCWAAHQTITDPAHAEAARVMRQAHRALTPVSEPAQVQVEHRDLAVYDALGSSGGQGAA